MDIALIDSSPSSQRLLLAVDRNNESSGAAKSLLILECDTDSSWHPNGRSETLITEADDIKADDLQKLLYTNESLRKTTDFE